MSGAETQPNYVDDTNAYYYSGPRTGITDTSVTAGVTYYYTISNVDASGEGPMSGEVGAVAGSAPLSAPTLRGTPGLSQDFLRWNAVPGADSYNVYRGDLFGNNSVLLSTDVAGTSYTDSSASNGKTYSYTVCASRYSGQGSASNVVYLTPGIPDLPAPTGVTATASGSGASGYQIVVQWTQVPGTSYAPYYVYRSTTPGGEAHPVYGNSVNYNGYGLSNSAYFTDTHVTAGVTYYYQVSVLDSQGESPRSLEVSATPGKTPPAAPALTGTPGAAQCKLSWTAVSGASTYNVYRSDVNFGGLFLLASGLTGLTYTDTAVTDGTTYHYSVQAENATGQGLPSNTVQVTSGVPDLPAPTGLTATVSGSATSGYQIVVQWTQVPGTNYAPYYVYRSTTPGGEGKVFYSRSVGYGGLSNSAYFTDTHVTASVTYYYKVTALDGHGESPFSAEISAKAAGAPLAAPILSGTSGAAQCGLSWTSATGAATYNVYRSDVNFGGLFLLASGLTTLTYTDSTTTDGTTYHYSVQAENATGQGLPSNTVQVTSGVPDLPAPVGLTATASGDAVHGYAITVQWTQVPGTNYAPYYVYRSTTPGGEGKVFYSRSVGYGGLNNSAYFTDTHVTSGGTYYYKVTALDSHGESPQSAEVSAKAAGVPLAASKLTGTPGAAQCQLSWTAVSGATTYNVYRSDINSSNTFLLASLLTGLTYTDTAVTDGGTYHYFVQAESTAGQGLPSNTVQVTSGVPDLPAPRRPDGHRVGRRRPRLRDHGAVDPGSGDELRALLRVPLNDAGRGGQGLLQPQRRLRRPVQLGLLHRHPRHGGRDLLLQGHGSGQSRGRADVGRGQCPGGQYAPHCPHIVVHDDREPQQPVLDVRHRGGDL